MAPPFVLFCTIATLLLVNRLAFFASSTFSFIPSLPRRPSPILFAHPSPNPIMTTLTTPSWSSLKYLYANFSVNYEFQILPLASSPRSSSLKTLTLWSSVKLDWINWGKSPLIKYLRNFFTRNILTLSRYMCVHTLLSLSHSLCMHVRVCMICDFNCLNWINVTYICVSKRYAFVNRVVTNYKICY